MTGVWAGIDLDDATAELERFSFSPWLKQAAPRMHRNKLATALANKLARISWSVLTNQRPFDTHLEALPAI